MAKTPYNKMSRPKPEPKVEPVEVKETTVEKIPESVEEIVSVYGEVVNCNKLNLRTEPSKTATVLKVLNPDTEVEILDDDCDESWYHVKLKSGLVGYCMKDYIGIKL